MNWERLSSIVQVSEWKHVKIQLIFNLKEQKKWKKKKKKQGKKTDMSNFIIAVMITLTDV